ncbi:tetratricopeptide repeat protein [Planctomycetota bacterium]
MTKNNRDNYSDLSDGLTEGDVFKRPLSQPDAEDLFTVPFAGIEDQTVLNEEDIQMSFPEEKSRRLSNTQTFLLAGIVFVVIMLFFAVFRVPKPISTQAQSRQEAEAATPIAPVTPEATTTPEANTLPAHLARAQKEADIGSLSLGMAENLYRERTFDEAYTVYYRLHGRVKDEQDTFIQDFLVLRMALCAKGLGQMEQEAQLLGTAAQSQSPIVRAMARYHQSLAALRLGQPYIAMVKAYQALALADVAIQAQTWHASFTLTCRFLVFRAATMQALSLRAAEQGLPETLWNYENPVDPFLGLDPLALRSLLASGSDLFAKAALGPRIQRSDAEGQAVSWQVACNGASIDELIMRFAANVDVDVDWSFDTASGQDRIDTTIRRRPIHTFLVHKMTRDVFDVAAGCAQLFVEIDSQGTAHISDPDPATCPSLSVCSKAWTEQAIALWRRFVWAGEEALFIPNAHFALGLLHESRGRPTEAIGAYRILADRYAQSLLAPYALLRSSRLKTQLHDYLGARDDLKLLVDQYPDVHFAGEAILYLADASLKAGLQFEAFQLYKKVYNMDMSLVSRTASALGAGASRMEQGSYPDAMRWLIKYLDLAVRNPDEDPQHAYLLLGKTFQAMDKPQQACDAYKRVLTGTVDQEAYFNALRGYAEARLQLDDPVDALNKLQSEHPWTLSRQQNNTVTLLTAQALRSMSLLGKAKRLLEEQLAQMPDREQRAQAYGILGQCALELNDVQGARQSFSEVLVLAQPGVLMQEASLGLARVCMALNDLDKTVEFCQQVLAAKPEVSLEQQAMQLLAQAYEQSEAYDRAAQVLLRQSPNKRAPDSVSDNIVSKSD